MDFIKEFFNRLFEKSPRLFVWLQWISGITLAISGLPLVLTSFETQLGVELPAWIDALSSKAVTIAAIVAWIIARLPIKESYTPPAELPFSKPTQ